MIKEKSQLWASFSLKLGKAFSKLPIPPNVYTWLTVFMAAFGLWATTLKHIPAAIILFILAGLFDIADGAVARYTGRASHFGAFLDGSLDRFVDFFLIFSYFWLPLTTPLLTPSEWISIAVFCALMPSFEVAYANHRKAVHDPDEKRIWRILNRGEMYPLMLLVPFTTIFNTTIAGYVLAAWVVLAAITTLQTLFMALYLAKFVDTGPNTSE